MNSSADHPNIRPATLEDAPELARLMSLFNNDSATPSQAAERLKKLESVETALLAYHQNRIAGMACLRVAQTLFGQEAHAEVVEFYIEAAFRGGELEGQMLRDLEALARQRGAGQITLLAGLKNTDAQAIYRASGYQEYALLMRKLLGTN